MGKLPRVLVVDDEPQICRVFQVLLGKDAEIVTASDGAEATVLLSDGHFDAVLSDVVMPRVDGVGLLRWIEAHRPELTEHIVFISGALTPDAELLLGDRPVFAKPVTRVELQAALELAIAGKRDLRGLPQARTAT